MDAASPRAWVRGVVCWTIAGGVRALWIVGLAFKFVYRALLGGPRLPKLIATPESEFEKVNLPALGYAFQPNYFLVEIPGLDGTARMHYIDEGPKDAKSVVLCLHGEPSWSFLYRKMVGPLVANGCRVIVPDFIGFGKSDKLTSMGDYSHAMHKGCLRQLLEGLDVRNVTLVCQDWGGITGLPTVKDLPDRFSNVVMMNTGLFRGDILATPLKALLGGGPFVLWQSLVLLLEQHLPVRRIMKKAMKLNDEVADAYSAPFPDSTYKAGAAQWPLLVPLRPGTPVAVDIAEAVEFYADPARWTGGALIMFSDNDPVTRTAKDAIVELFPNAPVVDIHGGGHFLQEEKGPELAANILKHVKL